MTDFFFSVLHRFPDGKPFVLRREREVDPSVLTTSSIVNLFSRLTRLLPRRLRGHDPDNPYFRLPRRLTSLLLDLASLNLSEDASKLVVEHFQIEDLCLPFHTAWIDNLNRLVRAFYNPAPTSHPRDYPDARKATAYLVFTHVYTRVKFSTENRTRLLEEVILPLLDATLDRERIPEIAELAFSTLVDAAVFESRQRDKEAKARSERAAEGGGYSSSDSAEAQGSTAKGCFEAITKLLVKIGSSSTCGSVTRSWVYISMFPLVIVSCFLPVLASYRC